MAEIRKIEPKTPKMKKRKKVAAYARVSAESDRMMHSLSAQVSYYSKLIQSNPEWEYAGVYAEEKQNTDEEKFLTRQMVEKMVEAVYIYGNNRMEVKFRFGDEIKAIVERVS